jgi:hypothetical protein
MNFENMWSIKHNHTDIVYVSLRTSSPRLYEFVVLQFLDHRYSRHEHYHADVHVA